jgi:hypothetical protein
MGNPQGWGLQQHKQQRTHQTTRADVLLHKSGIFEVPHDRLSPRMLPMQQVQLEHCCCHGLLTEVWVASVIKDAWQVLPSHGGRAHLCAVKVPADTRQPSSKPGSCAIPTKAQTMDVHLQTPAALCKVAKSPHRKGEASASVLWHGCKMMLRNSTAFPLTAPTETGCPQQL